MKKPFLRVSKWLGDIPVEAYCSLCAGVTFKAQSASHRPNREEYQKSLQAQFNSHMNTAHANGDAGAQWALMRKEADK